MQDAGQEDAQIVVTGGCQCGAVRYRVGGTRDMWECNVCHCRMCQKASGGPFMAFINVPRSTVTWTRGARATFTSSSIVTRSFCRDCGTPLTYERTAERLSISHGSLDEPIIMDPGLQLVGEHVLPWTGHIADLPSESLSTWAAALPEPVTSYQHPDRDA